MTKDEFEAVVIKTLDPSFKGAVAISLVKVLYENKLNKYNYTLTVCKKPLFVFQFSIYFRKNSFLEYEFNKKISAIKASGLMEHWVSRIIDANHLNALPPDTGPKKLNIAQLKGGFEVWLMGLSVGIIVFLLEAIAGLLNCCLLKKLLDFVT